MDIDTVLAKDVRVQFLMLPMDHDLVDNSAKRR